MVIINDAEILLVPEMRNVPESENGLMSINWNMRPYILLTIRPLGELEQLYKRAALT